MGMLSPLLDCTKPEQVERALRLLDDLIANEQKRVNDVLTIALSRASVNELALRLLAKKTGVSLTSEELISELEAADANVDPTNLDRRKEWARVLTGEKV